MRCETTNAIKYCKNRTIQFDVFIANNAKNGDFAHVLTELVYDECEDFKFLFYNDDNRVILRSFLNFIVYYIRFFSLKKNKGDEINNKDSNLKISQRVTSFRSSLGVVKLPSIKSHIYHSHPSPAQCIIYYIYIRISTVSCRKLFVFRR